MTRPPAHLRWLLAAALSCTSYSALAAGPEPGQLSEWRIDKEDPAAHVPSEEDMNKNPLQGGYFLMDLTVFADKAMRDGNYAQAVKYFKAMQAVVPDRSISFGKECEAQEAMGRRDLALAACKTAMNVEGVRVVDAARYVRLLSSAPGGPSPADLNEATAVLAHLRKEGVDEAALAQIECDVAIERDDTAALRACSAVLDKKAPKDPKTVSYLWALAAKDGDYSRAKALLARAKQVGVAPAALEKMLEGTRTLRWAWLTPGWRLGIGALVLALVAGIFVLFGRRARAQGAAPLNPSPKHG